MLQQALTLVTAILKNLRLDEVATLLGLIFLFVAIVRSIVKYGGFLKCVRTFIGTAQNGGAIILYLLLVPTGMFIVNYALLVFVPEYRFNIPMREAIGRPSLFTMAIILGVFFMNGKLVEMIRRIPGRVLQLWNRFGRFLIYLHSLVQ